MSPRALGWVVAGAVLGAGAALAGAAAMLRDEQRQRLAESVHHAREATIDTMEKWSEQALELRDRWSTTAEELRDRAIDGAEDWRDKRTQEFERQIREAAEMLDDSLDPLADEDDEPAARPEERHPATE